MSMDDKQNAWIVWENLGNVYGFNTEELHPGSSGSLNNHTQHTGDHSQGNEIHLTEINKIKETNNSDTNLIGHGNHPVIDIYDNILFMSWIDKNILKFKVVEANQIQ
jgi:hypothetical protein